MPRAQHDESFHYLPHADACRALTWPLVPRAAVSRSPSFACTSLVAFSNLPARSRASPEARGYVQRLKHPVHSAACRVFHDGLAQESAVGILRDAVAALGRTVGARRLVRRCLVVSWAINNNSKGWLLMGIRTAEASRWILP